MATKKYFVDSLINTVHLSENVNDVLKLLNFIPFASVRSFIIEHIKAFNLYQSRKAYYMIKSINDILPSDITQHIVSFNESKDMNSIFGPICKLFKQFAEKNEENYVKQLTNINNINSIKYNKDIELKHLRLANEINQIHQRIITLQFENSYSNKYEIQILQTAFKTFQSEMRKISDTVQKYRMQRSQLNKCNTKTTIENTNSIPKDFNIDNFDIKYNKSVNNIWIIDKNRNNLNEREKKLFCKGPFDNFDTVMPQIKSGDKIYIFNDFKISNQCDINKHVQIIGVSNNKLINCNIDTYVCIQNKSNVFFENIKFTQVNEGRINVDESCGLWVNNSIFEYEYDVISSYSGGDETNVIITNCDFYGVDEPCKAIRIASGNLNVNNCMFLNGSEWNDTEKYESVIYFTNKTLTIECIGNKFIDNYQYPIGCPNDCDIDTTKIKLQNNCLIGFNGIHLNKKVSDANKCYVCEFR